MRKDTQKGEDDQAVEPIFESHYCLLSADGRQTQLREP
jgi:hypothetical protein